MARKLGEWDLRCNEAVLAAMLVHPRHGKDRHFVDRGAETVRRGNWAFAAYLPRDAARDALMESACAIARKQQRSGLWRRKNGEHLSFAILRALAHAEVLGPLSKSGQLRYGPFQAFAARQDYYGLVVRKGILRQSLPGDSRLETTLQQQCLKQQRSDGSWGGVVSATAFHIERLLDLGLDAEHPAICRAASWMLGHSGRVERCRPKAKWSIEVSDMITTDSHEEFALAQDLLPESNLAGACFIALPILPTALALKALVRLGLHGDARVKRAYDSLLDMQFRDGDRHFGRALSPGWCGHQCRFKLEARLREGGAEKDQKPS